MTIFDLTFCAETQEGNLVISNCTVEAPDLSFEEARNMAEGFYIATMQEDFGTWKLKYAKQRI